ncbi:MAG: hypothetical protein WED15_09540 [Akkermansiaceae bacterium]
MKPLIPIVSMLAVFSCAPTLSAENANKRHLSIFCPVYAEGLKSVFVKTGEDSYRSIALSTANVIDAGEVFVEAGSISLHGPAVGGKPHPDVATADAAATRHPLLVLIPARNHGELAYESKLVEGDLGSFPLGSYQLVNLAPHAVRVTSGKKVIEIEANAETLFKPSVPAGEVMTVTVDHQTGGDWKLVSSAQWASRADRRTLVCFLLDPVSKRMVIKSVPLRGNTAE